MTQHGICRDAPPPTMFWCHEVKCLGWIDWVAHRKIRWRSTSWMSQPELIRFCLRNADCVSGFEFLLQSAQPFPLCIVAAIRGYWRNLKGLKSGYCARENGWFCGFFPVSSSEVVFNNPDQSRHLQGDA